MHQAIRIVALSLLTIAPVAVAAPTTSFAATSRAATPAVAWDFNGDGVADLAVPARFEDVGGKRNAGAVNVIYGSATGPSAAGDQFWTQASPGVRGAVGYWDIFGTAIASGDFDRDGYADLAIGAPGDDVAGVAAAGSVTILYGTRHGLVARQERWSQANLPGKVEYQDYFGDSLAVADFDADGYADLAIGVLGEVLGGTGDADGTVQVLRGGPHGLRPSKSPTLSWPQSGVPAMFGASLAAGDLDGDGYAELVASSRGDGTESGAVAVFAGSPDGLTTDGVQTWSQDSPGIVNQSDPYDYFGYDLAIGDFDADGYGDLAAAVFGEHLVACPPFDPCPRGAVAVLHGSAGGLTADGNELWGPGAPGLPGPTSPNADFGVPIAAGDLNGDGADDLAVGSTRGACRESVVVLYGSSGGLPSGATQEWGQCSPGVPGSDDRYDGFGDALTIADYGRTAFGDLAIGVPGEAVAGHREAGRLVLLFGTDDGLSSRHAQSWSQDTRGIKDAAEAEDWFGGPKP